MVRQGWVTASLSELIDDDDAYRAAPHYRNFRRPLDCDDNVVSVRLVDVPRRPEAISINRPHGASRFGRREVTLHRCSSIARRTPTSGATSSCRSLSSEGLSKRLNETLSLLLEGKSEKEAARQLGLSERTVHGYVTTLYEHFRVCSRAELLAYFVRRQPRAR